MDITLDAVRDVITQKYQDKPFDAYDILAGLTNLSAEWIIEERYDHTLSLERVLSRLIELCVSYHEITSLRYCKRAITFQCIQPDVDAIDETVTHMYSAIAHQLIYEKENIDPLQLVYEAVG
jgi:hypothetical protein